MEKLTGDGMTEKDIKFQIMEKADKLAHVLVNNHDVEIRKEPGGIKIIEVRKSVIK